MTVGEGGTRWNTLILADKIILKIWYVSKVASQRHPLHTYLAVLDGRDVERGLVREHESVGREPLVPREEDGVEHRLVEEAVTHPLADDDVDLIMYVIVINTIE